MKGWLHILLLVLPALASAQDVAGCTGWLASVDEASQRIVLSWHRTQDPHAMGYHICTGTSDTCRQYAVLMDCDDTSYICPDHSPLERHHYGLHVFDSNYNTSPLTPFFGNMVLQTEVPQCETGVSAWWSPYENMPKGDPRYSLWVRLEPFDTAYDCYYVTSDTARLHYSFEMPEAVTRAWLKVEAEGEGGYRSLSNVVCVERRTVDRASFVEIEDLEYDSIETFVRLDFHLDNNFAADHYTLYRSIDGSPWREINTFATSLARYSYIDRDINPFDSLHCYQLGVKDACGMNEQYSPTACLVVPTPPLPAVAIPNIVVAGDEVNGCFRPVVRGLLGTLYELHIYNRQGLLVFQTSNPTEGWTPPPNCPQGAYAYHLRCQFNNGFIKNYTGVFTLIR